MAKKWTDYGDSEIYGICIAIGVAIGISLMSLWNAAGIAIGLALGVAAAESWKQARNRKHNQPDDRA